MARVLVVGCGCRGRTLCQALIGRGHSVRATTRMQARVAAIEQVGADGVIADPDRLTTLVAQLAGVTVVCLLLGSATGPDDEVKALHLERLPSLVRYCVDTQVRGIVYEGAGSVHADVLAEAARALARIGTTHRMPIEIAACDPKDFSGWLAEIEASVLKLLSG